MTDERTEQDITRVCRTASQLYGDLIRLLNIQPESAIEQQALQLILDSYETVGLMAMEVKSRYEEEEVHVTGRPAELEIGIKSCGCGPGQSCHTCLPLPGGITF